MCNREWAGARCGLYCPKAAIEAGGTVVAVVPNELPDISPRTNYQLAMSIIEQGGAAVSEWMKGDNNKIVNRWSFLERNRLVSGQLMGIIITEAAERSGTLNTASHVLNQGKRFVCSSRKHNQPTVGGL